MIPRTWLGFTVALLLSLISLSACVADPGLQGTLPQVTPSSAGSEAAVVHIGRMGSPDSLNPGVAQLNVAYTIFELVYDSMFNLELDGSITPILAQSFEVSDDGTVWTFHIYPNLTFHDGEPLTAHDIAFSYNFYKENVGFPLLNSYTQYFESIEAPDDQTVTLTLTEAIPTLEYQLLSLQILPEHIWSAHTEGSAPVDFENLELIGSGPFKLVEYVPNEFIRLAANPNHHLTPPLVDEVIFQTFASEDALVQALRTGQVDMITQMPQTAVATLRNAENIQLVTGAPFLPEATDIAINQIEPDNCPTDVGGLCTGHPALRDLIVRSALAHATDKQNLIDVLLLGLGAPGLTLTPQGVGEWYNDTLQDYPFDIAKANQLLDDAGYLDSDGDGVREMPDGTQPLIFRLNWPTDVITGPRMAELLGQTWGQIGIQTEPQAIDPNALIALCCPGFDYDIMLWAWLSDPDPGSLLGLMRTSGIAEGFNESGYANPAFDELYDQQATELDKQKRQEIVWQMQEMVHNDIVYIVPYYAQAVQAYRSDRFSGWLDDQPRLALEDVSSLVQIQPVE